MKDRKREVSAPAEYIGWCLSILKEFYVVIDVDAIEDRESDKERLEGYYTKSFERVV